MLQALRTARGVFRSLRIYYGGRERRAAMDRLYAQFVKSGDLVFDIGAHVGDRIASFRRLGARVIAVEPQPALVATLGLIHGLDRDVRIEAVAVGAQTGRLDLRINVDNPTISTASPDFMEAARDADGWQGQHWERTISVPVTTLDALIERHGQPFFIKIDVEGFEAQALQGLSRAVPALSFEFTTIQRDVARLCIARCVELGYEQFNAALGESQQFIATEWRLAESLREWLDALPHAANSGDIYARLA
jgi:FkbM family methyltransferase